VSSKPESVFIGSIHKLLPKVLHREKMHNAFRGGTPDVYYSGDVGDLWVEYKYLPKLPARSGTLIVPGLSELQIQWLRGRYEEGRNVAVIVGVGTGKKAGGVIFVQRNWERAISTQEFRECMQSKPELAEWISTETLCSKMPR